MSRLIDSYVDTKSTVAGVNGLWIAKPIPAFGLFGLRMRVRQAIEVLRGKAIAVHFKEDEWRGIQPDRPWPRPPAKKSSEDV